jgi:hypothetical protein
MWYRKALDLNELNKEYSEEHNKAINKYEDILENITIEDIFRAMDAGEEWSSDSGAIKVNQPQGQTELAVHEVDGDFNNQSTDVYDVYEGIRDFPSIITSLKNTAKTISVYVDSGVLQEFNRKLDSLSPILEKIIQSAFDKIQLIESSFNNPELSRKFSNEGYPTVTQAEADSANSLTEQITRYINEFYNSIKNEDAKQEWLNVMARKGVAGNFLRDDVKAKYTETINNLWRRR